MNVIENEIKAAVDKELTAACERFPMFASLHEAAAVIFEEYQESAEKLEACKTIFDYAWQQIRLNNSQFALSTFEQMKCIATKLAVEACQVAAMCEKAIQSAQNPVNIKELEDKHWSECMQIAHYDDELQQLKGKENEM